MTDHLQKARNILACKKKERALDPQRNGSSPKPKTCGVTQSNYKVLFPSNCLIRTGAELSEAVTAITVTTGPVGFDVETYPRDETARSLDPRRGHVGVISLSCAGSSFVIDTKAVDRQAVREALEAALSGRTLIAHNAPFDLAFTKEGFGYLHDGPVHDTLVLDAMLFYATGPRTEKDGWRGFTTKDKESGYKRSLEDVARARLGREIDKTQQSADWGGPLTDEMVTYAATDTEVLLPLQAHLVRELEVIGMGDVVDLEARFTPAMAYASANGFALDVEGWRKHAADARAAIEEAKAECDRLAPAPPEDAPEGFFWAWSAPNHRKVGLALELLGATVEKRGTGNYITGEAALKAITSPAPAAALGTAILRYRANEKYVTTWSNNWFREPYLNTKGKVHAKSPDHLIVIDGRAYTKLNQLVATGRGSSKKPNMQNLPEELRKFFIAPPGRKLLVADYSQMEYVAAAHIAGDEVLLAPLREGEDFHQMTADMLEVEERARAKMVNFGLLYGMGAKGLGKRLGISPEEAQVYIDRIFERAPGLAEWYRHVCSAARAGRGYVITPLGRRRLVDLSLYRGRWEGNRAQSLNSPIQGACADGYKMAGALIWERRAEFGGNPLIVNMIHDEYVLEVDDGPHLTIDAALLQELMIEGMRIAIGDAPITVKVDIADNWAEKGD